jgi:hypothetical protein
MKYTWPPLELKTRPRFCPVSWSLPMNRAYVPALDGLRLEAELLAQPVVADLLHRRRLGPMLHNFLRP